jgi:hypothetical protein
MNKLVRTAAALLAVIALAGLAWAFAGKTPALGPLSAAARGRPPFDARVIERLAAGSYTYLHVERANQTREWVVTLASSSGVSAVRTGGHLRVTPIAYSERFESKRLARAFDRLHFAMVRPL